MADYNRFVSYIYLYERGIKAMNTGFAKVESRGGQCRVNISMKNMYHENHIKFSVYMFVRQGRKLVGIYLGDLTTQNSAGEFFGITDSGNIQDSGYRLEDVKGMIIRGENGKIYGTGWDDEALDVNAFIPLTEYIPEEDPKAPGSQDEKAELRDENTANDNDEKAPESNDEKNSPEGEPESGEKSEPEGGLENFLDDTDQSQLIAESVGAAARMMEEADEDLDELEEESRNNHDIPASEPQSPMEKIIEAGMRMYPFEDDQVAACVRLEPQDIGLLPMKYWRLASNSFMLHGYYSYRHLIMARTSDGTYIFGVPGVNYERERFMAHMFGFDKFKPVRAGKSAGNEFGYWYMELGCSPAEEAAGV